VNDQPDEIRMREAGLASLNRAGLAIRLTCSVEPPRILNKEAQTNQISDDTLSHRTRRVLLAIIFGMALILRGGVVWQMGAMPVTDALEYHTIAVNQLAGLGHALEAGRHAIERRCIRSFWQASMQYSESTPRSRCMGKQYCMPRWCFQSSSSRGGS